MTEHNQQLTKDNLSMSAGALLKATREKKNISLESAAAFLRLRRAMVIALEEDDYAQWSSWVYFRGHLHRYACWLGLDFVLVKQALLPECFQVLRSESDSFGLQQPSFLKRNAKAIIFSIFCLILLLLIVLGFGVYHWVHHAFSSSMGLAPVIKPAHQVTLLPVKAST